MEPTPTITTTTSTSIAPHPKQDGQQGAGTQKILIKISQQPQHTTTSPPTAPTTATTVTSVVAVTPPSASAAVIAGQHPPPPLVTSATATQPPVTVGPTDMNVVVSATSATTGSSSVVPSLTQQQVVIPQPPPPPAPASTNIVAAATHVPPLTAPVIAPISNNPINSAALPTPSPSHVLTQPQQPPPPPSPVAPLHVQAPLSVASAPLFQQQLPPPPPSTAARPAMPVHPATQTQQQQVPLLRPVTTLITPQSTAPSTAIPMEILPSLPPPPSSQAITPEQQSQNGARPNQKFESALDFLEQVKRQYADRPAVYNQFLEIMREFKNQTVDTSGVIDRVKELFLNTPHLVYGFNSFLPPGFKIEPIQQQYTQTTAQQQQQQQPQQQVYMESNSYIAVPPMSSFAQQPNAPYGQQQQTQPNKQPMTQGLGMALLKSLSQPQQQPQHMTNQQHMGGSAMSSSATSAAAAVVAAATNGGKKAPEIDLARNFIKKIKTRFADQPQTYKTFIEILHAYNKESQPLPDVYEKVAILFRDQPDLLDEFKVFLPEPGQDGQQVAQQPPPPPQQPATQQSGRRASKPRNKAKNQQQQAAAAAVQAPAGTSTRPKRRKDKTHQSEGISQLLNTTIGATSPADLALFTRIKETLEPSQYAEFLKCLNLFGNSVVSKAELVTLVRDVLLNHMDLFDGFKRCIMPTAATESSASHHAAASTATAAAAASTPHSDVSAPASPSRPASPVLMAVVKDQRGTLLGDLDLQTCKRKGQSYRILPTTFQPPRCSGRTELDRAVLNDTLVSVRIGSENYEGSVINHRVRKFYDAGEAVVKCEDERYELDMAICHNASTIRAITSMMQEAERKEGGGSSSHSADLCAVTIKHLMDLYGERGVEIIKTLKEKPLIAGPVVLKRLKAKMIEWERLKSAQNKQWRVVHDKHFQRFMDGSGHPNRRGADRKQIAPNVLISQVCDATEPMSFPLGAMPRLHRDIAELMAFRCDCPATAERIAVFVRQFIAPFFALPIPLVVEFPDATSTQQSPAAVFSPTTPTDVKPTPPPPPPPPQSAPAQTVFYGSAAFLLFFRIYAILHSKLVRAHEMAVTAQKAAWNTALLEPSTPSAWLRLFNQVCPQQQSVQQHGDSENPYYLRFLEALMAVKAGVLDQQSYEEECHTMFGPTFVSTLFDVPYILSVLGKYFTALITSDTCCSILSLWMQHQFTLKSGVSQLQQQVYDAAQAMKLIGENEFCFCFQYQNPNLFISVVPTYRPRLVLVPIPKPQQPSPQPPKAMKVETAAGVRDTRKFITVDPIAALIEGPKQQPQSTTARRGGHTAVFLRRNMTEVARMSEGRLGQYKELFVYIPGLQTFINTQKDTHKLCFSQGTEDTLYWKGSINHKHQQQHSKRKIPNFIIN